MENFDPLFDEDPISPVRLSLPTFEALPPIVQPEPFSSTLGELSADIFDKNVGTIALPGSQRSEHPPASSLAHSVAPPEVERAQFNIVTSKSTRKAPKAAKEPSKKRTTRKQMRESQQQQIPYKPATQTDAILAQLAKDPNIVPLLQAIVEYVYHTELRPSQQPQPASPPAEQTSERPTKRRRLNRVPAGAEDWAIPFPFQQGEGPKHYKETWEMKRLILLLSSLMRNLRDWRRQGGTISVNPLPPERPYRSRSKQPLVQGSAQGNGDNALSLDFLSQFDVPNPSGLDLSLESLLEVFSSYERSQDSALNVDLGALSSGDSISQILYETSSASAQTVPWDDYTNLSAITMDNQTDSSSFIFTPEASQGAQDVEMVDTPQLLNGMASSSIDLSFWSNLFNEGVEGEGYITNTGTQLPMDFTSDPGPDKFPTFDVGMSFDHGEQAIPDLELQSILDMALSTTASTNDTPLPSMSVSPSLSNTMEMTPTLATARLDITAPSTPSNHPVATLSKRGKGKSSQALRRDLNKSLRVNPVDCSIETPIQASLKESIAKGKEPAVKEKKLRVSEATLKDREKTLEQAKEWRELMVKELEAARLKRWEVTMEGVVLREVGLLVRNGGGNAA